MQEEMKIKGILIENERIKRYDQDKQTWKIKDFIEGICDVKVYRKLKKGEFIKRTEIYDQLFHRLGYEYIDRPSMMNKINKQGIILFDCHNRMDRASYQENLIEFKKMIVEIKDFAPFHLYNHLVDNLIDFVRIGKFITESEFNEYLRIIEIFPYEFQCLIKNLMIEFAFTSNKTIKYYHQIPLVNEKATFLLLQEVLFLDLCGNKLEALDLAKQLLERNKQEENVNCMIYSYSHVQGLYLLMTGKKDETLEEEIKPYLNHKALQPKSLIDYYMNEAVMCTMSKSYKEAFQYLKQVLSIHDPYADNNYYRAMVLLNYINTIEFVEQVEFRHPEPKCQSNASFVCFYHYFEMKNEGASCKELEAYLIDEVADYVSEKMTFDYKIFTKEVKACIKETRDYKILHQWIEKTKKNQIDGV